MRKIIIIACIFVAKSLCAQTGAQPLKINPNGSTDTSGASSLFWTSTANQSAIAAALSGKTINNPIFSGTMTGDFTRSGTTTGGTLVTPTITSGTLNGNGTTIGGTVSFNGATLTDEPTFDIPSDWRNALGLGTLATQNGTFSGTFSGTTSGTNTGDQTITLTGDVTGSGTGSFATTMVSSSTAAAGKIQIATDAQVQTGTNALTAVVPSSLSAWWTVKKTEAQTWAVNQTFNGTANTAPNHEPSEITSTTLLNTKQAKWQSLADGTLTKQINIARYSASRGGTSPNSLTGSGSGVIDSPYAFGLFTLYNADILPDSTTYSTNVFGAVSNNVSTQKMSFANAFTLAARICMRVDTGTPATMYMGVCETTTAGVPAARGFGVLMDNTGLKMWSHDGSTLNVSGTYITSGVTAPNNSTNWRNVLLSNAGTGTMTLYYAEGNNAPSATATATLTIPTSGTIYNGNVFFSVRCGGTFSSGNQFIGSIDNIRFAPFPAQ